MCGRLPNGFARLKPLGTCLVVSRLFGMHRAVYLQNHSGLVAIEIRDESVNDLLAPEV